MIYNSVDVVKELSRATGRCYLYLSTGFDGPAEELQNAIPFLTNENALYMLLEGELVIECTDEDEMERLYDQVVGDDGPTALNSYDGRARAYALTIANGEPLNENT